MIRDALLGANTVEQRQRRLAGVTVLERQLFVLARAGIRRVWVEGALPADGAFRKPPELEIIPADKQRAPEARVDASGRRFYRIDAVRAAAQSGGEPAGGIDLDSLTGPAVIDWLMDGLRKDTDGFMAKYFDRRISMAVTRRLLDTPVRPNHLTIVSTLIGLTGGLLFFFAVRRLELLGAFLIWLHTVLDGCDGEMARLTFRESSWGAWLDFWGDNVVHVALFLGLAVGQLHRYRWAPVLGFLACLGSLGSAIGSAWLSAKNRVREDAAPAVNPGIRGMATLPTDEHGFGARLKNLEMYLAQRDFIYVLLLCAAIDRLEEFLWAAAFGAPLFLVILIYLARHPSGKVSQPRPCNQPASMIKEPV